MYTPLSWLLLVLWLCSACYWLVRRPRTRACGNSSNSSRDDCGGALCRVVHTPPRVADYVVIGAGPAGVAACRALLLQHEQQQEEQQHDTQRNKGDDDEDGPVVLLVECGDAPLPLLSSTTGMATTTVAVMSRVRDMLATLLYRADWRRLLCFAPDMIDVPTAARVPGCAQRTFTATAAAHASSSSSWWWRLLCDVTGACVCDEGLLARRPLRRRAHATMCASATRNNDNDDNDKETTAQQQRRAHAEAWLVHTPYPRGRGVDGTALLDWGMQLPSVFDARRRSNDDDDEDKDKEVNVTRLPVPPPPRLPTTTPQPPHMPAQPSHPLSWAFAKAVAAMQAHDTSNDNDNNENKSEGNSEYDERSSDTHATMSCVRPPLRIDADGRRLCVASALLHDVPAGCRARLQLLHRHAVVDVAVRQRACDDDDDDGNNDVESRHEDDDGVAIAVHCRRVCAVCRGSNCDDKRACSACSGDTTTRTTNAAAAEAAAAVVRVRRGVVVAAGAVHTPRLLHRLCSSSNSHSGDGGDAYTYMRDAVALPLMFEARHGISADVHHTTTSSCMPAMLSWWLTPPREARDRAALCEVFATLPLPDVAAHAELCFVLLPFGGRHARRYYAMGWDRVLGVYAEAFVVLLVLHGVPGLQLPLCLQPHTHDGDVDGDMASLRRRVLCASDGGDNDNDNDSMTRLPDAVASQVQRAFCRGIERCRALCATPPLCHLTRGRVEAVDCTLLADAATALAADTATALADSVTSSSTTTTTAAAATTGKTGDGSAGDATRALRLAQLLHTPRHKYTRRVLDELRVLQQWASAVAHTPRYMHAYVQQHAYWLGFGSGSAVRFLQTRPPLAPCVAHASTSHTPRDERMRRHACWVRGLRNVVVADVSAVVDTTSTTDANAAPPCALHAASVATALDCGHAAAMALSSWSLAAADKTSCV